MKHPNAAVAAGGSSLSAFIVWIFGNVFHWSLSAEDGAVIAGAVSTVVLVIGRSGVRGLWRRIWDGEKGSVTVLELLGIATLVVALFIAWKVA